MFIAYIQTTPFTNTLHLIHHQAGNRKRLHQTVAENATRIAGANLIRREHQIEIFEAVEHHQSRFVAELPVNREMYSNTLYAAGKVPTISCSSGWSQTGAHASQLHSTHGTQFSLANCDANTEPGRQQWKRIAEAMLSGSPLVFCCSSRSPRYLSNLSDSTTVQFGRKTITGMEQLMDNAYRNRSPSKENDKEVD